MTDETVTIPRLPQPPAGETASDPGRLRGHAPKIQLAHLSLKSEGRLPKRLRPVERNRIVLIWLGAHGYGDHLPSRQALDRYFEARDT